MSDMMIFHGNANPALAQQIAENLGLTIGKINVGKFSDGETMVEVLENVRGKEVFLIQPTSAPTNDNLMELVAMADAFRRASARKITAVVPYFGYARQDRRVRSARVPITAQVVARMMTSVGVTRLLTVDLHADQIQGFFQIPVDNVYSTPIMIEDIEQQGFKDIMVVSPDVGGVVRARAVSKRLPGSDLAIIDKRRPEPNLAHFMHIIGDVKDRDCIIVDDIIDTAGTLCMAVEALKSKGARKVVAYITHPVLSGDAVKNIEKSKIDELVVTDTIPLSDHSRQCKRIRQITLSNMLAQTMRRISDEKSVSSMFLEY